MLPLTLYIVTRVPDEGNSDAPPNPEVLWIGRDKERARQSAIGAQQQIMEDEYGFDTNQYADHEKAWDEFLWAAPDTDYVTVSKFSPKNPSAALAAILGLDAALDRAKLDLAVETIGDLKAGQVEATDTDDKKLALLYALKILRLLATEGEEQE